MCLQTKELEFSMFLKFLFTIYLWIGGIGLEFELRASCLQSRHSTAWTTLPIHFCSGCFGGRVSWTIYPGWPWISILPNSAFKVAKIISVNQPHLTEIQYLMGTLEGKTACSALKPSLTELFHVSWGKLDSLEICYSCSFSLEFEEVS
jgi:hypothetical protein